MHMLSRILVHDNSDERQIAACAPRVPRAMSAALSDSAFRLLDGIGELDFVINFDGLLHDDDALAAALTCRSFYDAACRSHPRVDKPQHAFHGKRFFTRRRGVVRTVELLRWATEQCGLPLSTRVCKSAAQDGRMEALVWARERGCEWDVTTCYAAAAAGHLDILVWAYKRGAPINTRCAMLSFWMQHHEMFHWLVGDTSSTHLHQSSWPVKLLPSGPWVPWRDTFKLVVRGQALEPGHALKFPLHHKHTMGQVMNAVCIHTGLLLAELSFYVRRRGAKVRVGFEDTAATLRLDTQNDARMPILYVCFVTHSAAGGHPAAAEAEGEASEASAGETEDEEEEEEDDVESMSASSEDDEVSGEESAQEGEQE